VVAPRESQGRLPLHNLAVVAATEGARDVAEVGSVLHLPSEEDPVELPRLPGGKAWLREHIDDLICQVPLSTGKVEARCGHPNAVVHGRGRRSSPSPSSAQDEYGEWVVGDLSRLKRD